MRQRHVTGGMFAAAIGGLLLSAIASAQAGAPLADAAERGDKAAVLALLKQAADVNAAQGDGMTALHWAAMHNQEELAGILLHAGANTRATTRLGGYTPPILAAENGRAPGIPPLLPPRAHGNGPAP